MLPKPQSHVFVCNQVRAPGHPFGSCSERKAEDVFMTFMAEVRARGLDGRVQVTNTGCLGGPCSMGPTVIVYPDAVKYHKVETAGDIAAIIEEHLVGGVPVERLKVPAEAWS